METYREFRDRYGSGKSHKVPADIAERWANRIVAQGMHGRHGGGIYMGRYGKGIGVQKLVALALCAEQHVFDWLDSDEMAQYFWEVAYQMATGETVKVEDRYEVGGIIPFDRGGAAVLQVQPAQPEPVASTSDAFAVFPPHLRPGAVVTMQPTDAKQPREYYVNSPAYCGQPKRDGCRMVVFATPEAVAWQARSQQVKASPSAELDAVFMAVAADIGPFVLDGELWWPDANNGEHRTAPQAATANVSIGAGARATYPVYAVFECLSCALRGGFGLGPGLHDLTEYAMQCRFDAAETITSLLVAELPAMIEYLRPVFDRQAKRLLAEFQHSYGREGEVWRLTSAPYLGGKTVTRNGTPESIVRTKYLQTRDVVVTGFTVTGATKLVRAFAAIQVADPVTGKALGNVGTGFTQADQQALVDGFAAAQAEGRPFVIEVASQGVTEFNVLWHPRFVGIKE